MHNKNQDKSPIKKPRGNKRERTRQLLIKCASELVAERGFDRTTLEDIASRAGVTRGAIYGNFSDREELFLAVAESMWAPIAPPLIPGASLETQMNLVSRAIVEAMPERSKKYVGVASFYTFALTHEEFRKKVETKNGAMYEVLAQQLAAAVAMTDLDVDTQTFVRVAHMLVEGIFALNALTPELIDPETVRQAFRILARGASSASPEDNSGDVPVRENVN